jgi:drug/metabolite transporter (DMT)-like permease
MTISSKSAAPMSDLVKARLMLVALCLAWGLTWPAMRVALIDIPPFTMRAMSALIGTLTLFAVARLAGKPVRVPPRAAWLDIVVISIFTIVLFSRCATFAQLMAFTGRVAILVYTMPIWSSLLARVVLGERFTAVRAVALTLCVAGMVVLIYPLAGHGVPLGLLLALGSAVSWALGTIYIKWRRINIEAFTLAAWQLVIAFFVILCLVPVFESGFHFSSIGYYSLGGVLFSGFFGSGVAYFLWFRIIQLLPATTASLGALASPVIGVVSSIFVLGETPTLADSIGFALIFAASACVLLQPNAPTRVQPEHP